MHSQFRLFLPLESESELARATLESFAVVEPPRGDARRDLYLVGASAHWGCKLRYSADLEVKFRTECSRMPIVGIALERYSKTQYRGGDVTAAAGAIASKLHALGIEEPSDAVALGAAPRWLPIDKARRSERLSWSVSLEVARLRVGGGDSDAAAAEHASTEWLSVAVEADAEADVLAALAAPALVRRLAPLADALSHCVALSRAHDALVPPVLGGYPTFVRHAARACASDERVAMLAAVDAFGAWVRAAVPTEMDSDDKATVGCLDGWLR